jgi:hypothetical protein
MNQEWNEEASRFGNIFRGPQGVLLPENVFREIEQDMDSSLKSELNRDEATYNVFLAHYNVSKY